MTEVTAGNPGRYTISFENYDGVAAVPDSATYAIHDVETKTVLRAATAISGLATSVELLLTSDDTAMQNSDLLSEWHCITVVANHTGESPHTDYHHFKCLNKGCG